MIRDLLDLARRLRGLRPLAHVQLDDLIHTAIWHAERDNARLASVAVHDIEQRGPDATWRLLCHLADHALAGRTAEVVWMELHDRDGAPLVDLDELTTADLWCAEFIRARARRDTARVGAEFACLDRPGQHLTACTLLFTAVRTAKAGAAL